MSQDELIRGQIPHDEEIEDEVSLDAASYSKSKIHKGSVSCDNFSPHGDEIGDEATSSSKSKKVRRFDSFDNVSPHGDEIGNEASLEAASFCKSKKVRRSDSFDDVSKLCMAIESIANAIIQSTNAIIAQNLKEFGPNSNPTKDCDVWAMLVDLGFSPPFLTKAYAFLIMDPKIFEALIRCPNEHRKSVLLTAMGHDHESSD